MIINKFNRYIIMKKSISLSICLFTLLSVQLTIAAPQPLIINQLNINSQKDQLIKEAEILENQGTLTTKKQAIEKYLTVVKILQNENNPENRLDLGIILKKIGGLYASLSEAESALKYYHQALQIFTNLGDVSQQAQILHTLGMLYNVIGERQKVLDYLDQAKQLYAQINDQKGLALTLSNMGWIHYFFLGAKEKGMELYLQSLKIYEKTGDRFGETNILIQIAWGYYGLENPQQAINYYQQAIKTAQQIGYKDGEAKAAIYLSQVYESLGNEKLAFQGLMRAEKLYTELGNQWELARVYRHLGSFYGSFKQPQKGIKFYQKSILAYRELGGKIDEGLVLGDLGRLYKFMGNLPKALDSLNQLLAINKFIGDRYGEADALYEIAQVESEQNHLQKALIAMESSIKITENLRTSVYNQNLRSAFFANRRDRYEFYINLLMKLHQNYPESGFDGQALYVSESSRARSLLELLAEAKTNLYSKVDTELLAQENKISEQIEKLEKQRIELLDIQNKTTEINTIENELWQLNQQYEQIKDKIKISSPNYAAITQPEPLNLKKIQSDLLDDDSILLEYYLGEEVSYLWTVTKTSINSYKLPKKAEIEKSIQRFQQEELIPIRIRPEKGPLAVDTLSQILLKPVLKQIKNKRLVIVADGRLQTIPFSALIIPEKNQKQKEPLPLISQNEIINLPSASALAVLRNQVKNQKIAPKTIAIIADPVFGKQDQRFKNHGDNSPDDFINNLENAPITEVELKDSLRDSGIKLKRLLGTRQEAEAIMALVPATERKEFFDFQANKSNAINPDLGQYQIIHFATHGILNTVHPELSGVVMSLVDEKGISQNGFLRLRDIFNLNLSAELVVLSACQTGQGQEIKGEGIIGLTRGFMYAGSKRVLVSLWKVDDQATAELMKRFYRGLLQEKLTATMALKQAQLEMSQIPQWRSPYYWGAFVLQGEWR
jgi:CHAT domain-containing protein